MKITVITVCLNSVHTIEKTIKSVIAQAYHDLEYIVVDGGSTDGTLDILEKYDTYIHKWISEPDESIFDAMNKGIGMATGDVIAFLNSDDWYEPNALKIIEDAFHDNDCDCVYCDNYIVDKKGDTVYFKASTQSSDDIYMRMICYHSAIFCKKDFFEKKGNFNLKYKIAADYDWFLRMSKLGLRVHYISQPVFTFCYGGISSVNEIDCAREARAIALYHLPAEKKEYTKLIEDRFYHVVVKNVLHKELTESVDEKRANILWGAGARGKQCVKLLRSAYIEINTIVDSNSLRWGEEIWGIRICSPDILLHGSYNLIITPDDYNDIEKEVNRIGNDEIHVFKFQSLIETIVDTVQINKKIPVIWGLDKKYVLQAFVVMRSILLNSKETYHFLILTADDIEDEVTEYADILKSEYNNFEVSVRVVDINCFTDARIFNAHLSKAAYFRLLIPELVPEYDKCIYLDCDIIVHGDLRELYAVELEGNYIAGVKDCHVIKDKPYEIEHQRVLGLPTRDKYINSGVLVINLKKIRDDGIIPLFHEQLKKENWYEDQDVLNYCCYPLIKLLPLQYNLFHFYLGKNIKFLFGLPYEFDFNHDCPFILHMGGKYKPWSNFDFSGSNEWWQIADVFRESGSYQSYRKKCKKSEIYKEIRELVKRAEESEYVIVWGYTEYGMKLCDILLEFQLNNVEAIADNNKSVWGEEYRGIPVKGFDSIIEKYDNIFWIISCQVSYPEVIEQLKNSGVKEKNIFRYINWKNLCKDEVYFLALHEDAYDRKLAGLFSKRWE